MRRWWPSGLSARIIALTLLTLIVSQAVAYLSFSHNQDRFVRRTVAYYLSESAPAIGRMLEHVRPGQERAAVRDLSSDFASYDLVARPFHCSPRNRLGDAYVGRLRQRLNEAMRGVRICVRRGLMPQHPRRVAVALAVPASDGRWLQIRAVPPGSGRGWPWHILRDLLITAVIMIVVVILVSRRITRPLRDLAWAAERFGRGEKIQPPTERGSDEIRRSLVEFNRMHERVERFVAERTRLIAALAHDLRTPITALRLRLELLADDDNGRAMQTTLDDMAHMTEAALTFMREEAATEASRRMDLTALVDAVCEDYRTSDEPVAFEPGARITLVCRPVAIRRALRNVIDNALTYGGQAEISLEDDPDQIAIEISDRGPGIDEADMSTVFEAFVRLEPSRNRDSGGAGLGLAIARTVVRSHGGDITLRNRSAGGLVVRMVLPKPSR